MREGKKNFVEKRKKCLTSLRFRASISRLTLFGEGGTVPCKLNNAKTNKTPWTIDELFKFRVNEFKPTKILE